MQFPLHTGIAFIPDFKYRFALSEEENFFAVLTSKFFHKYVGLNK